MIKVRMTALALGLLLTIPTFAAEVYEVNDQELDALMDANVSFMEQAIAEQDGNRGQKRGNPTGGVLNAPIPKPIPARQASPNNMGRESRKDSVKDGTDSYRGVTDSLPKDSVHSGGDHGGGDQPHD